MTPSGAAANLNPIRETESSDLRDLWQMDGAPPLVTRSVSPDEVPDTIAALLGQTSGMTRALQQLRGTPITLDVLAESVQSNRMLRKVRLCGGLPSTPLALALIAINIGQFTSDEVTHIRAGKVPFGALLNSFGRQTASLPSNVFAVEPSARMIEVLALPASTQALFGRFNTIRCLTGPTLATVVEIIAPTAVSGNVTEL